MDDFELEQLQQQPKWISVLSLYHELCMKAREESKDFDGWIPRIHDIPDTPKDELAGIHGKLIAFGFLKFDLTGRDAGIRYQLTPLGKQGIPSSGLSETDEQSSDFSDTEELLAFRK